MGDGRRTHKLLLGNQFGKRPRNKLIIRWKNNIISDLKEIDYEDDWKTLAHDKVTWRAYVLATMNLAEACNSLRGV